MEKLTQWLHPLKIFIALVAIGFCFQDCSSFRAIDLTGSSNSSSVSQSLGTQYYQTNITPAFQQRCITCHVAGGVGPMTIYDYSAMKAKLTSGMSSLNNDLMNKVKNVITHTGGDLCPGDVKGNVSPCDLIKRWAVIEDPLSAVGPTGVVTAAQTFGQISGWALDTQNQANSLSVLVYVDGAANAGGTLAGTYTANMTGTGNPQSGHYFNFQLPSQYMSGTSHQLYIYANAATSDNLLANAPYSMVTQTGQQFFNTTVLGKLTTCKGCHSPVDYPTERAYLASPGVGSGGAANSNTLITNAAGGLSHSGGVQCPGGLNADPCLTMQQWWLIEFGQ